MGKKKRQTSVMEDDDLFDIWMNLGFVIGGRTRHLEKIMTMIKNDPDIKLVFSKSSGSRLKIVEDNGEDYYNG